MTRQIVENFELFSEAQLESLEFLPEELENIESELYPNLESISLEEVAKDLEAYFEGDIEEVGLEARSPSPGPSRGRRPSPDPSKRQSVTKGTCFSRRGCSGNALGLYQHCHNCSKRGGKSILRNSNTCENCK
jgi:hypothetical protein